MFAILSKGIDLTIGASAALVACITASLVQPADYANAICGVGTLPAPLVFLIGLVLGAVIGGIYGAIIAYTKIPPSSQLWRTVDLPCKCKDVYQPSGFQPV